MISGKWGTRWPRGGRRGARSVRTLEHSPSRWRSNYRLERQIVVILSLDACRIDNGRMEYLHQIMRKTAYGFVSAMELLFLESEPYPGPGAVRELRKSILSNYAGAGHFNRGRINRSPELRSPFCNYQSETG